MRAVHRFGAASGRAGANAISAGGDTDTVASIAGQLAGTVAGAGGVPHDLLAQVAGSDELQLIAEDFAEFVAGRMV